MNIINHFKKKSNLQILQYFLIFFIFYALTFLVINIFFKQENINQTYSNYFAIYFQFVLMILPFKFLKTKYSELNVNKSSIIQALKYSIAGYFIFICTNLILVLTNLMEILPGFGQQENIIDGLINSKLDFYIIGAAICIFAPVIEEVVFRGYIYNKLKTNYSKVKSSVLTSIIFAGIHFQFEVFSAMFVLSLIIHWVYEKSNGINGAIAFHILNNTLTFIIVQSL